MAHSVLGEFIDRTAQKDRGQGLFELETDRVLEVNLKEKVWIKSGSMVAYTGDIRFKREGLAEHGLGKMIKRAVTGEGIQLTKAEGQGVLYVADLGKKISVFRLEEETLVVNGNDLLAFEPQIAWDIKFMRISAMLAGGLTNIVLKGPGLVAITSHYDPLTLRVTPDRPVMTDPNATVAWSGGLSPQLKTDVSLGTILGRGSGDTIQLKFEGDGFVVVQPYEEVYLSQAAPS